MNPVTTIIHRKAIKKYCTIVMFTIKQSYNQMKYAYH